MKTKNLVVAILAVAGVSVFAYFLNIGSMTEACARVVVQVVVLLAGPDIMLDRIAMSFFVVPIVVMTTLISLLLCLGALLLPAWLFIEYTATEAERAEWREQDRLATERYREQRAQERLHSVRNIQPLPPRRGPR